MPTLRAAVCSSALGLALFAVGTAQAQKQEQGILVKVKGGRANDESFAFNGADKKFGASSASGGKQASVRAFNFGRAANLRAGGSFQTRDFAGKRGFETGAFATKPNRAASEGFAGRDKNFGVGAVEVREAPAANKSLAVQGYEPAGKLFAVRGKRQNTLDELRKDKNLTIDEIREILNKPDGNPRKPRTPLSQMNGPAQTTTVPQMNAAPTFR